MSSASDGIAAAIDALGSEHLHDIDAATAVLLADPAAAEPALIAAVRERHHPVAAARLLAAIGTGAAVGVLLDAAREGGESLCWHAAMALGAIAAPGALDALLVLAAEPEPDRRRSAAWALGTRPEPAAHAELERLGADDDPRVRDAAERALAGRGGARGDA